jgi:RNA polymerase sigma-70 factor, ECF subfamily
MDRVLGDGRPMATDNAPPTTQLLRQAAGGDIDAAERLLPLIYDELHGLACAFLRRERPDHTLQPTALVNEAYLRLIDQSRTDWNSRAHFFAIAAQIIRRILVDHARARQTAKRGGHNHRIALESLSDQPVGRAARNDADSQLDLLELEQHLTELNRLNPRHHRIIELRFYGGLTIDETAEVLGVSPDTVKLDWRTARAWLRAKMNR